MKAEVAKQPFGWSSWSRRERDRKEINGQIRKLEQTAQEIRADHGLDQLADDIEQIRAQGQEAMEEEEEDEDEDRKRKRASSP